LKFEGAVDPFQICRVKRCIIKVSQDKFHKPRRAYRRTHWYPTIRVLPQSEVRLGMINIDMSVIRRIEIKANRYVDNAFLHNIGVQLVFIVGLRVSIIIW
jgi:hypothetical protein